MPLRLPRLPPINHRLTALAVFGVLGLGAFGAIQMFGDPGAAGPRRVISLAPGEASAETAPRVSLADAMGEEDMSVFDLSELPPYEAQVGEINASGQLRVSVVETPESGAAAGGGGGAPVSRRRRARASAPTAARADCRFDRARPQRPAAHRRRRRAHLCASLCAPVHTPSQPADGGHRHWRPWL